MKNNGYKCFFITPIGNKESKERENSDRVLQTLLQPALAQCGFSEESIIRSDMDAQPGRISHQMESHLSKGDLCIADLTGINPNVMYELGFRKGLGKPVIIIAASDTIETLPFDVKDERIITYDFSGGWKKEQETRKEIQRQVTMLLERGLFDEKKIKAEDIFNRLNSIEQKLETVLSKTSISSAPIGDEAELGDLIESLGGIEQAFEYCLSERDIANCEKLLPRLAQATDKKTLTVASVRLASIGSLIAGMKFKTLYSETRNEFDFKGQVVCLASYIECCCVLDMEPEELEYVIEMLTQLESVASSDKEKALVFNQKNRINYGTYVTLKGRGTTRTEYLDATIESLKKAIELDPADASYRFNYALTLFDAEKYQEARKEIQQCVEMGTDDYDHLVLAYRIFKKVGDNDQMMKMDQTLMAMNAKRWRFDKKRIDD